MSKISIIVPIYNSEKYLKQCIESLITQTFKNIEIILINDGSTDKSKQICEEYAVKDDRIKLINKNNEGVSVARNIGIKIATGKYIAFIDSDDWLEPIYLETLYNEISKNNADLVICNYNIIRRNKKIKNIKFPKNNFLKSKEELQCIQAAILSLKITTFSLLNQNFYGAGVLWNKLYKREIIEKYNLKFNMEKIKAIFEDVIFNYNYIEQINSLQIINETLYNYRTLQNSATRAFNKDILQINQIVFKDIKEKKLTHKDDKLYEYSLNIRIINNFYTSVKIYFCNKKNTKRYKEKVTEFKETLNKEMYKNAFENLENKYCNAKTKITKLLVKSKKYNLLFFIFYIFTKIKEKK